MLKSMCHDFKLDLEKPKGTLKGSLWSVATGEWVPRHYLKLDTIFPFALGPMIAQEVSSRIFFRGVHNGMLLPPAVWGAFNNVSVAPKAKASESSLCTGCRYPSWSCRVLSPAWPPSTGSGLFTLVLDQGLLIGFLAVDTCHRPREVMSLRTDTQVLFVQNSRTRGKRPPASASGIEPCSRRSRPETASFQEQCNTEPSLLLLPQLLRRVEVDVPGAAGQKRRGILGAFPVQDGRLVGYPEGPTTDS